MNVLVTGASGFVGQHVITELQQNGHTVTAATSGKGTRIEGIQYIAADLSDYDQVVERFEFTQIDVIIHLAGITVVGPSFDEPLKYITINAGLEINLYQACIAQDARPRFLIVSSGSVYDPSVQMPINELSPVAPNSPYAVSKLTQESLAQFYAKRGFEYIITRPFNHIGPGQGIGFIVPDFAKQIAAGERGEISELLVGNLEAKRDYTDVRDIAKAYRLLIESGKSGELYNICSGNSFSGQDILDGLLGKSSARLSVRQDPARMRPADIQEIVGDRTKITQHTGWQPTINLDQTLTDVLSDWRNR